MRYSKRDLEIIRLVSGFGQLAGGHIRALVFADNLSDTPCARALARLTDGGYLHRVERRMVGGNGAGSGQYVYGLGVNGYRVMTPRGGKFTPARQVKPHTLAVADAYVALANAERAGLLTIAGHLTEPDTWQEVEGIKLRPDMVVELITRVEPEAWWLEIDTGTEGVRDIADKMNNLLDAKDRSGVFEVTRPDGSQYYEEAGLVPFPRVVWIAPDMARVHELEWVAGRLRDTAKNPRDVQFDILEAGSFPQALL